MEGVALFCFSRWLPTKAVGVGAIVVLSGVFSGLTGFHPQRSRSVSTVVLVFGGRD